ncbi:MAG: ABC transporter substrate-binding protein [Bacteroidales bacterium]|nr:ABC transporter substrate-binding protein [Bacteroidales bacterium]
MDRTSRMEYAQWFKTLDSATVVVYSPYGGADTLRGPLESVVCMSSSYVGYLDAIGAADAVKGVSGLKFIGTPGVDAVEVGYDAALDYEAILRLKPDLFITYTVSSAKPPYLAKLCELGIPVVILSEHLESHPLARAEYVKLFGALTGRYAEQIRCFPRFVTGICPLSGSRPGPKCS